MTSKQKRRARLRAKQARDIGAMVFVTVAATSWLGLMAWAIPLGYGH